MAESRRPCIITPGVIFAVDPIQFLRTHPPFDRLGTGPLERVARGLEIVYQPRETRLLQRGGPPNSHLFVIRKGTVRLERDGELVQVLEEGECFGFPSLIGRTSPHVDVVTAEDTLLYQIPSDVFDALMEVREFADFFLVDLSERLRRATARRPVALSQELATPVGSLTTSAPVHVSPSATVGEAARVMRDKRISSVLVDGHPPGILTDRDLRCRVLAEGRGPDALVETVATRPARTIPATATLFETLVFMLEQHVHHAPLTRDGDIVGVVTDTDLLRLYARNPLYLLRNVERARLPEDYMRYASELAAMVETMVWGGLAPAQIGPVVSRLNDALVARLVYLAQQEMGPAPVPFAWIVFGSEGRMEQTLLTDQDNALVYADDGGQHETYFARLADRVVHALIAAAVPPCPGGFMATNWRKPLDGWVRLFRGWIETPEPRALVEALNFFDFRVVCGTLDLGVLDAMVQKAGRAQVFMAHLARASIGLTPPLTAFRHIREGDQGVDLKKGGLAPIVSLARLYALEAGSRARSTLDRLQNAASAGMLSADGAETLAEGFRFLLGLRLREQLRALRAGEALRNSVPLEQLQAGERQHLKDIFVATRDLQRATALRYAVDRLA